MTSPFFSSSSTADCVTRIQCSVGSSLDSSLLKDSLVNHHRGPCTMTLFSCCCLADFAANFGNTCIRGAFLQRQQPQHCRCPIVPEISISDCEILAAMPSLIRAVTMLQCFVGSGFQLLSIAMDMWRWGYEMQGDFHGKEKVDTCRPASFFS
jgi:hypothetical protein